MAEAREAEPSENMKCPICLDTFTRPRSLPCLHTFCERCLSDFISNGNQSQFLSYFRCPVCRADTKAPRPYSDRSTWTEQFPINLWVVNMMEEVTAQRQNCQPSCEIHTGYQVCMFCSDHQAVCCPMCVATKHRQCSDVQEIAKIVESKEFSNTTKEDLVREVTEAQKSVASLKLTRTEENDSTQARKEELISTIRLQKQMLLDHIESLEMELLSSLNTKYDELFTEIGSDLEWCEGAQDLMKTSVDSLSALAGKDAVKAFIVRQKVKSSCQQIKQDIKGRQAEHAEYVLILDEGLVSIPDNFTSFGKITESSIEDEIPESETGSVTEDWTEQESEEQVTLPSTLETVHYDIGTNRRQDVITQVQGRSVFTRMLNPTLQSDKRCWVSDIAIPADKKLLVCDHTNRSLKLFKEDGKLLSDSKQFTAPWCVAVVPWEAAVVSYPAETMVRLFDLSLNDFPTPLKALRKKLFGSSIKLDMSFTMSAPCYGVTYLRNVFVVCCENCLKVFSLKGRLIQTLSSSSSGDKLFCKTMYIAANPLLSRCYLTDEGKNTVSSFKLENQKFRADPEFVFSNSMLKSPQGICVDCRNHVYVAGFVSRNIFQLSEDGQLLHVVPTTLHPWAIAVNKRGQLLLSSYPDSETLGYVYCYRQRHM